MPGESARARTHPLLPFSSYRVSSNNHAACCLQSKRLSYCPCTLSWSNSPECNGRVKGNADAVRWKAGLTRIQEGMPGWPIGLCFKALNLLLKLGVTTLLIANHHHGYVILEEVWNCAAIALVPYVSSCSAALDYRERSRAIISFNGTAEVMTYQRQNETNKDENIHTHIYIFKWKLYHRKLKQL